MARNVINTRIELDHETDAVMRKIDAAEDRKSKRSTISVVLKRLAKVFMANPQTLRELGIIRD